MGFLRVRVLMQFSVTFPYENFPKRRAVSFEQCATVGQAWVKEHVIYEHISFHYFTNFSLPDENLILSDYKTIF
jgi:hypothetical protein